MIAVLSLREVRANPRLAALLAELEREPIRWTADTVPRVMSVGGEKR